MSDHVRDRVFSVRNKKMKTPVKKLANTAIDCNVAEIPSLISQFYAYKMLQTSVYGVKDGFSEHSVNRLVSDPLQSEAASYKKRIKLF